MLQQIIVFFIWIIISIIFIPVQEYSLKINEDERKKLRTIFYAFFKNLFIFLPITISFLFPKKYLICIAIVSVLSLIFAISISTILKRIISIFNKIIAEEIKDLTYWFFILLTGYIGFYIGQSNNSCKKINDYSFYIIISIISIITLLSIIKKILERRQQVKLHQQYLNKDEDEEKYI